MVVDAITRGLKKVAYPFKSLNCLALDFFKLRQPLNFHFFMVEDVRLNVWFQFWYTFHHWIPNFEFKGQIQHWPLSIFFSWLKNEGSEFGILIFDFFSGSDNTWILFFFMVEKVRLSIWSELWQIVQPWILNLEYLINASMWWVVIYAHDWG